MSQQLILVRSFFPLSYILPSSFILLEVTGSSGFLGAHITRQLLAAGYRVRGYFSLDSSLTSSSDLSGPALRTARAGKIEHLRVYFQSNPNFEAVQVDDIGAEDLDLTTSLNGE